MNRGQNMFLRRIFTFGLVCSLCFPGFVGAESPPAFPNFEAKRIKPPKKGAKKRIQVQIEERANPAVAPVAPIPPSPTPESGAAPVKAESQYDWFWKAVLPQSKRIGPARLEDALTVLSSDAGRTALPAPRLQSLQDIAQRFGKEILLATVGTEVSPAFALAVIYTESAGRVDAQSAAGAQGLMQLIPATADRFDVKDVFQPADNIKGGVKFLDTLMKAYQGDPILVLAAYNAGEGAVRDHKGVPPYAETLNYVPKVLNTYSVARGLCITPPLLVSDGCVFAAMGQ